MSWPGRPGSTSRTRMLAIRDGAFSSVEDDLATEEPLEIRALTGGATHQIAVTMRTPGNDFELVAGFLLSEGLIASADDVAEISYCTDPAIDHEQQYNIVNVRLHNAATGVVERLERHFVVNSSCGVCGKATIESLATRAAAIDDAVRVSLETVRGLPAAMHRAQRIFASTGGLHACALFDSDGHLLCLREDVGRHNAFDKLAGWAMLRARLPLQGCIGLVSGRASFELIQKAIVARLPILCAISAPSSLAVNLAEQFNVTLVGFLRDNRANVYTHADRIALS